MLKALLCAAVFVTGFSSLTLAAGKTYQTSFDCSAAPSGTAFTICHDAELAALDRQLLPLFDQAKQVAASWNTTDDGEVGPFADWFKDNAVSELKWREQHCQDKPCLLRWYARRRAFLGYIASAFDALGEDGAEVVAQLDDDRVVISVHGATYDDNWLVDNRTLQPTRLPDGSISILSQHPLRFLASGKKSYLSDDHGGPQGAIWFNEVVDQYGIIYDLPGTDGTCVDKSTFVRTTIYAGDLSRVVRTSICYQQ